MKPNMGMADKAIRITLAMIIVVLYVTKTLTGPWGLVALIVAGIFFLTSFMSFCPIYALFGWSTHRPPKP